MPRIGGQAIKRNKPRTRAQRRLRRLALEKARLRREAGRTRGPGERARPRDEKKREKGRRRGR